MLIKFSKILNMVIVLLFSVYVFSYMTFSVLPDDEKLSSVLREVIQFIETDIVLNKIVKIDRKGVGDYYFVYKPESGEIQILKGGQRLEFVTSFLEKDVASRISETVYDVLLNRVGIPVKNILLGENIQFSSLFIYADSYLIRDKDQRIYRDFTVNYNTGEITLTGNFQNTDRDSIVFPLNSFGSEIFGPFSPVITSKVKVDYIPTISRVYLKNYSSYTFYTYLFTEEGLYGNLEVLSSNSSKSFQINWRSKKAYLAVSEIELNFENFDQFKLFLKASVESGKTVIYSFRFPDKKTFKNINTPSVESFDYDYLNKKVLLKLADSDFQKSLDEYILIINNEQEFTFRVQSISFTYLKPLKEIQIIKRRVEEDITFESQPKIFKIQNMPPGILLERYEVRNGEFLNFTLADIDGDQVKITNFQADSSGIQIFGNRIFFTKATVGECKITFKLSDGKTEVFKDNIVRVVNTPPEIRKFDVSLEEEFILVNFEVFDPDPQSIRTVVTVKNTISQDNITKTSLSLRGEVRIKLLPLSGMFDVNLTVNDGISNVTKNLQVQYDTNLILGQKNVVLNIFRPTLNEKIIKIQKQDSTQLESLKLVYTISQSNVKPSSFWELINSEDLFEIEMKNLEEIEISANRSGYYHFWFITKDSFGQIYFDKLATMLINQSPQLSLVSTGISGFQGIINVSVFEPDNDDYIINSIVRNLETNHVQLTSFDGKTKVITLYFDKAGLYDIEIYAVDIFGSESKRERIRVQIPSDLPKFSILAPNNTILKASQSTSLRWELENTKYNLPVTYDVYVGESDKNLTLYTSTNNNSVDLKVVSGKTYYWKVVARFSKNLFVESSLCKFSVEKDLIVYKSSVNFSSNVLKIIENSKEKSEFYVVLSNGDLIRFTLRETDFEHKKIGTLYSTFGDFKVSDSYLINYSTTTVYVYNLNNFSLIYWSNFKNEILFASVYNDTLVLCTNSQIFLYNLGSKKSSVQQVPQVLPSNIELFPIFDEKRQLLIFPDVSNILFIDIANQKIVRQELIFSRGNIFYCDILKDDIILTLDVYGQMNTYKISEKSVQFISLNELGISYPMKIIRLEKGNVVFSKIGKISVFRWDEAGIVRSVLNEVKETFTNLLAPTDNSIIYLTKNRIEYYKHDNISLLTLLQIKELPMVPADMTIIKNWLIIQGLTQILVYEIQIVQ